MDSAQTPADSSEPLSSTQSYKEAPPPSKIEEPDRLDGESTSDGGEQTPAASTAAAPPVETPTKREMFNELIGKTTLNCLMVEPRQIYRRSAKRALRAGRNTITVVKHERFAYDLLLDKHYKFDLVLVATGVHGPNRLHDLIKIREVELEKSWTRIPIFAMSSVYTGNYHITSVSDDLDAYIGRPLEVDQLYRLMDDLRNIYWSN